METRNPDFFNVLWSDKINSDKAAETPASAEPFGKQAYGSVLRWSSNKTLLCSYD